jgi:hypothetical protein
MWTVSHRLILYLYYLIVKSKASTFMSKGVNAVHFWIV